VTIQVKDDAGWVARVVCVVSGRGFNDDPCAATCTSMVDEGLKGGADRVHADCFQRLSDVGGWVLGDFKRAVPLLTLGAMRGTALAAHKEEVRTGGCAEHNRFAPAGLELFYQCWLDRSLGTCATRLVSSRVRRCAAERRPGSSSQ